MLSGSKILFNSLYNNGVKYVFGYSGGAILPVLNEFYNQNKIKFIMSRTELGAGFMAEGYSKSLREPGIVMTTSGPGALNTITSLQNALSDGTPLLVLSGQVSTTVLGTQAFQEANLINISKACTKWNNQIIDGKNIETTVNSAFSIMMNERHGPVLIDLPKNIMSSKYEINSKKFFYEYSKKNIDSNISNKDINNLILNAKKPVILAGQGVLQADAINLLRIFSRHYNIPVTTTLMGLGILNEKDPLSLKMLGMHGSYFANMAIHNCDLLLNFGSRFDDRIIGDPKNFAPNATIVHIDNTFSNINKTIKSQYFINNDCKYVLFNILFKSKNINKTYSNWHLQINEWKKIDFKYPNKDILQGRHVIKTLNNIIHKDINNQYTIVSDVGAHQMWAAQFIDYNIPKVKLITSGGLGSMGFALPASIGVKIANPFEKVICICGDGGFTMTMVELLTAIDNKINIKVIIINNNYQLMVKMWQEKFYNNQIIGTKMNNPSFEKVCKSLGCYSLKIDSKENLEKQLEFIINYEDGPIVANIITDSDETVLPMVSPGSSLNNMILEEDDKQLEGEAPC